MCSSFSFSHGRFSLVLLSTLICVGAFQPANASPLCTTASLASYLGTSCNIGNVLFSFSAYAYSYTPDDTNVPPSSVTVTPIGTGQELAQTGFRFSASGWYATDPDTSGRSFADMNLTLAAVFDPSFNSTYYDFNTTTLLLVASIANATGNTGILAAETVTDKNYKSLSDINLVIVGNTDAVSEGLGGTALSGTANFKTKGVIFNKDLLMIAGDNPNSVQINSFSETLTYVDGPSPEPGSVVLAGIGLALLALLKRKKLRHLWPIYGILAAFLGSAHASTCTATDIGTVTTQGYSCQIGDAMFSNFSYSATPSGSATATWAPDPNVVPINDGGQVGFEFKPIWKTTGTGTLSITLTFKVYTLLWEITGFSASDTASHSGTGSFSGSNVTVTQGATTLATEWYTSSPPGGSSSLSPPVNPGIANLLTITNTFNMSSSGSGLTNSTQVSDLRNVLQEQTPEPDTTILAGGALLGLAAAGRHFRRRCLNARPAGH